MDKQKGRAAEPPKLVVTNKDKEDEKYGVDMVGDVAAEIRATFAKEPERFFLVGADGIEYGYSMDKLHEKLPDGGSCKVRFGDKKDDEGAIALREETMKLRVQDRIKYVLARFSRKSSSRESSVFRDAETTDDVSLTFDLTLPEREQSFMLADHVCGSANQWDKAHKLVTWLATQFGLAYYEDHSQSTTKKEEGKQKEKKGKGDKNVKSNHERGAAYPDLALMRTDKAKHAGTRVKMCWEKVLFTIELENKVGFARNKSLLASVDDLVEPAREGVGQTIRWYCGHIKVGLSTFLVTDGIMCIVVQIELAREPNLTDPILHISISQVLVLVEVLDSIVKLVEDICGIRIGKELDFLPPPDQMPQETSSEDSEENIKNPPKKRSKVLATTSTTSTKTVNKKTTKKKTATKGSGKGKEEDEWDEAVAEEKPPTPPSTRTNRSKKGASTVAKEQEGKEHKEKSSANRGGEKMITNRGRSGKKKNRIIEGDLCDVQKMEEDSVEEEEEVEDKSADGRPKACKQGSDCLSKDPTHYTEYTHTHVFNVGAEVEAKFMDETQNCNLSWWPAKVLRVNFEQKKYRIQWEGADESGPAYVKWTEARQRSPDDMLEDISSLKPGQQVMGFKDGFWFDAIIKKVCSGKRVVVSWTDLEELDKTLSLDEVRVLNSASDCV